MCLFAKVRTPRVLDIAPNGDVFIGSPKVGTPGITDPGIGGIYVLADDDRNGVADNANATFLTGVPSLHGVLVAPEALYYTDSTNVWRVPLGTGQRKVKLSSDGVTPADRERVAMIKAERFTHTLARDPSNGDIYVSSGRYDTDQCVHDDDPRLGAVLRVGGAEPAGGTVVVENCRNPMFLSCQTWGCYTMELSGDGWGDQNGAEKLHKFRRGLPDVNVGYPCCVRKGQRETYYAPEGETCDNVTDPVFEFRLGDTPFGFDWDVGRNFPAPYTGALFVAMHGSFLQWTGAGLQVLPWDSSAQQPAKNAKPSHLIPNGFGHGGKVFGNDVDGQGGRVSGLRFHPDGRLFFSDDVTGHVWWIAPKTLRSSGPRFAVPEDSAAPQSRSAWTAVALTALLLFVTTLLQE
jgi:glucose/arabinose dehydrogenase